MINNVSAYGTGKNESTEFHRIVSLLNQVQC